MCSSYQRQPRSAVAIATCDVQVSAAYSQTVPTVTKGVSKQLCCRLSIYNDHWEPIIIWITLVLNWSLYNYCSPRCWHHVSIYCRTICSQSQLRSVLSPLLLHLHLLATFQSDIPLILKKGIILFDVCPIHCCFGSYFYIVQVAYKKYVYCASTCFWFIDIGSRN